MATLLTSLPPMALSLRPAPCEAAPRLHLSPFVRWFAAALAAAAILVAATAPKPAHATTEAHTPAAPSLKKSETGRDVRWRASEVDIVVDPSVGQLAEGAADAAVASLSAWTLSGAALPAAHVSVGQEPGRAVRDGVNRIVAAPIDIPGHKGDLALTITYAEAVTGDIVEADIVINTAFRVQTPAGQEAECNGWYDVQSVITHELGHFWGLGEDRDETGATMYFETTPCDQGKRELKETDKAAVVVLYASEDEEPGLACSAAPSTVSHTAPGWAALGAALALALVSRRRSR
jgi:hypothetical protein